MGACGFIIRGVSCGVTSTYDLFNEPETHGEKKGAQHGGA